MIIFIITAIVIFLLELRSESARKDLKPTVIQNLYTKLHYRTELIGLFKKKKSFRMDLRNTFISLTLLVAVGLLNAENDDQPPFILDFRRPRVMNTVDFSMESLTVSLRCRNNDPLNPEFIRDPTFWRHDREQPSITTKLSAIEGLNFVMSRDRTTVMFRLTRRFEGNYSCGRESPGVVQRSNTRLLVGTYVTTKHNS